MKFLTFIKNLFGFKKNSKYVRGYLNDANIKSSIYMAFIIICLEIWMIFRQSRKYIKPAWNTYKPTYNSRLQLIFQYTSLYWLFIMCALAMFMFGLFYVMKKRGNKSFITNMVLGSLCILWIFLLIPEINLPGYEGGTTINKATTVLVYVSMPIFGASIIGNSLFRHFKNKDNTILSIVTITCFAAVCLLFGVKVGYSDFANPWLKDGAVNTQKIKMITCFLTMIIFVACLLIWKPYISIVLLTVIFVSFDYFLCQYGVEKREFIEADRINYYTFYISLLMITLSIYQQRHAEALKDEKLIHDANYDSLVNIHNLHHFTTKITKKEEENLSFMDDKMYLFINICNFKVINMQRGFDYGDKFLVRFAKDVVASFPRDYTARLGDDHFIVLTSQEGFMDKIDVLKRLVQASSDGLFVLLKVGGYKPKQGENVQRAIDKARYACRMIKDTYGIIYNEYNDEIDTLFNKRQYIVNHIDEAINNGYIKAHYQPVVWSNDKKLCGAEALARWVDPVYGNLSPREFVPVLEQTRLIHKLDRCMLEYVCKEMRRALDESRPVVPVSLNFSRLDFELMNVREELNKMVSKYNLDKDYIHVEMTESALSDNQDELKKIIDDLKNDGYDIWLDDFGSGYSSLNVLKDFKFDVVKIDMKFLTNFDKNERTKDVLDCVIHLATRLGMKALTEGVETSDEADFLNEIGCGRLQGYLFGKPYKIEDFEQEILDEKLIMSEHLL
ncbi:MAG: EAL domain-containing protein [bacterium]|nr:EAL domain-containing protein [bacterium]